MADHLVRDLRFNDQLYSVGVSPAEAAEQGTMPGQGILIEGMIIPDRRSISVNLYGYDSPDMLRLDGPKIAAQATGARGVYHRVDNRAVHGVLRCRPTEDLFTGDAYQTYSGLVEMPFGDLTILRGPVAHRGTGGDLYDGRLYPQSDRYISVIARNDDEAWSILGLLSQEVGLAGDQLTMFMLTGGRLLDGMSRLGPQDVAHRVGSLLGRRSRDHQ